MKNLIPVLALIAGLAFTACNKKASAPEGQAAPAENVHEASADTELQTKIFRGDCNPKLLQAIITEVATPHDAAFKSAREQYQFVGANITHTTLLYGTPDCSGSEAMILKESGTFTLNRDVKTADGAAVMDIEYTKLSAQSIDNVGAEVANSIKMCSMNNWAPGAEERDVTPMSKNVNCYAAQLPRKVPDVYRLDSGRTLYFGSKSARIFVDRPSSVDINTPYHY